MLSIDDTYYSKHYFELHYQSFAARPILNQAGKHIAICLPDNAIWLALCLYAKEHGLSVLPIHPSTPKPLAENAAKRAGCEVLFFGSLNNAIEINGAAAQSDIGGLMQMSSGTTGEPKCIKRSWVAIEREIASYIQHFPEANHMTPIVACPVTHSYGLICGVLVALARGLSPAIITNINPKFLLKKLRKTQKPLLYSSPAMLNTLVQFWPKGSKLHAAMTSGTLMSAPTFAKVAAKVEHLFQQYGCSEAGCVSLNRNTRSATAIGTVLPHLQVNAGTSAEQPAEVCVTVTATSEYEQPEVIFTQDLGYFEQSEQGQVLHFVSRQDDTIIVAGLNVYPQEVEDVVLTHPQIDDAVLFKVEDAQAGFRACLQYTANDELDADELRQWCFDKLASYQVPQYLQPVERIERLANGKVNRKKLALAYKADQQQASALVTG